MEAEFVALEQNNTYSYLRVIELLDADGII